MEQRLWETFLQAGYSLHLRSGVKIWNRAMPRSGFWREAPECSEGLLKGYTHPIKSIFFHIFFYKLPLTFLLLAVTSECLVDRVEKRAGTVYLMLHSASQRAVTAEAERRRSSLNRAFPLLWQRREEVSLRIPFTGCLFEKESIFLPLGFVSEHDPIKTGNWCALCLFVFCTSDKSNTIQNWIGVPELIIF